MLPRCDTAALMDRVQYLPRSVLSQNCLFLRMRTQDYAVPFPSTARQTRETATRRSSPQVTAALLQGRVPSFRPPRAQAGQAGRLKAWESVPPPPCSPSAGWPVVEAKRLQGNPMGA